MYHQYRGGWLEVICGCMFSGKTEELIRRINVLSYAKKNIVVFKPKVDNRYSDTEIVSHSGSRVPCKIVEKAQDILKLVNDDVEVVAIDEIQFIDKDIVDAVSYTHLDVYKRQGLVALGILVIIELIQIVVMK